MKILDFGSANIDIVYALEAIVKPGETVQSKGISTFPGGKGVNQAVALAKAGADCYFAGTIGADGLFLKELLESAGVHTEFIKLSQNKTGHAIIQVDKSGHNSIIIAAGANGENTCEYIDSVLARFSAGDYVVLQNEISNVPYIIKQARAKGMVVCLNPSPINEEILGIDLDDVDYLILNETEAECIGKTADINRFLDLMCAAHPRLRTVLTLGENGSVYSDKNETHRCLAYSVKAVDTTAAGDTYTGYFIAQLAQGHSVPTALKTASVAAAISVSRAGAAVSIPYADEIPQALKTLSCSSRAKSEIRGRLDSYIAEHLADATMQQFAAETGYSCDYLGKEIVKITGKHFKELLSARRCEKAAALLADTELTVGQICAEVGYGSESYFRTLFRAQYGRSPLEYRASLRHKS